MSQPAPSCLHSVERRSLKILQCDWLPALVLCPNPWLSILVLGPRCTFNPISPIRDHILANQSGASAWLIRAEPTPSHCHWLWDRPDLLEEISEVFLGQCRNVVPWFPPCHAAPFPAPSQRAWSRTSLLLFHFLQPINSLFLLSQLELVFCDFAAQKRPEALKCFRAHPSALLWICTLILCSGRL